MPGISQQRVDRALLIGIDLYDYIEPNLGGCVGDVERIGKFLVSRTETPPECIRTLVSRLDRSEQPRDRATRENIVAALRKLADAARPREQIYIHYSGHGMRNDTTILPGIESDGRDEAIATADSGFEDPANYYILDKELGWLIRQITDKQAFVTVILDCCHSASGTRDAAVEGGGNVPAVRRGWEGADPRPRTDANLVAPIPALKAVVVAPDGSTGSLVPPPENYVLLTACRENETAKEYKANGVFTHFFLEHADKPEIAQLTYRGVQDRVAGSVLMLASRDRNYDTQTPQLEGRGDLILFGGGAVTEPNAMAANPMADGTVLIPGAGEAVGVVPGTTIALYLPGTLDFRDPSRQIAVATAETVRIDAAVCRVPPDTPREKLVPGMRAVIVRPGVATIRRRVALVGGVELDPLREAIAGGHGSPFLELVGLEGRPELTVIVKGGNYLIRDNNDVPLPRITPPLVANSGDTQTDRETAGRMRQRLEHVVQYRNGWDLQNHDETSTLSDKLSISVERAATRSAGRIGLSPGDRIKICVHNRSGDEVSAALLYFSPGWKVERFWPVGGNAYTLLGQTGEGGLEVRTMDVALPSGQTFAVDRLKLFATQKDRPTSFDLLLLDTLDTARTVTRGGLRAPSNPNPLEALLESMGTGSATRELISVTRTGDWGTAELELETRRGGDA